MRISLKPTRLANGAGRRSLWLASMLLVFGCGPSTVTPTQYPLGQFPKPDRILVYDFAVTPADVDLDRGVTPTVLRAVDSQPQTEEEIQVGRLVAQKLTESLVQDLLARGLPAARGADAPPPGPTTASIKGRFLRIDQGDRTMRTLIGFGLGASQVRTFVQIYQGAGPDMKLVAEAETSTESNLKPGVGVMLGLGAATGGLAVAGAIGGASTIANEAVFATVQQDAKRTAAQITDRIANYYQMQGWLY